MLPKIPARLRLHRHPLVRQTGGWVLLLPLWLSACASPAPPKPQEPDAGLQAAVGVMLLAGAAQPSPHGENRTLEVRIPAAAIGVIQQIETIHAISGHWPDRAALQLPADGNDVQLDRLGDGLKVTFLRDGRLTLQCQLEPDGTVIVVPLAARVAEVIRGFVPSGSPGTTTPPIIIAPVVHPR